jgi:hypothetical protein
MSSNSPLAQPPQSQTSHPVSVLKVSYRAILILGAQHTPLSSISRLRLNSIHSAQTVDSIHRTAAQQQHKHKHKQACSVK